jgi:hypothetical protein
MQSLLNFGVMVYLVVIGLEFYLAGMLVKRHGPIAFTSYTWFVAGRSLLMFTLLSQGNSGKYHDALALINCLDIPLIAWIVGEQLGWPKVFAGIGLLGGVLTYFNGLNKWTLFALAAAAMLVMLKDSANKYVLAGFVIAIAFPAALQGFDSLPKFLMYLPTVSFLVAQAIWIQGLLQHPEPSK